MTAVAVEIEAQDYVFLRKAWLERADYHEAETQYYRAKIADCDGKFSANGHVTSPERGEEILPTLAPAVETSLGNHRKPRGQNLRRIVEYVEWNPGQTATTICDALGIGASSFAAAVKNKPDVRRRDDGTWEVVPPS